MRINMPKYNKQPWLLDEETNFPLPIYPFIDAPTVLTKHGNPYHKDPDDHHFFFPRKVFLSDKLNPGGQVVRVSRIQAVRRFYHDKAHNYMDPPPLIEDPEKQFGMSLLALLNFVPRQAIDLSSDTPSRVELSDSEYELLRKMTRVDFTKDYHACIGRFFIKTMINEHRDSIDKRLEADFLEARNHTTRRQIGNRILKLVSFHAVEPLQPTVDILKKQGEIPQWQTSPYKTVIKYARTARDANQLIAEALAA
jgi:hypothetical protein